MTYEKCWLVLPGRRVAIGDVTVEGDRIVDVRETPAVASATRLMLPGLVNCHGHTAMTLVRGLGGGLPLQRWLEEAIFPVEAKMKGEDIRAGVVWGAMEMLAGGTTEVIDMYDFPGAGEEAFDSVGLRASVSRVGLSFVPGRLAECIDFTRTHPRAHICIHSEYLTDESFCRALAEANNRELKRPVHVHVSETEREHRECMERHGGLTPTAYLAATGILDQGGFAAHCVHCTDEDFRLLAEKGVRLVHNPSSNMKLGSGFARISRALELGVKIALGTDGCASNDNLDMFEEMHLASLIHKGVAKDPTALPAWDVIEMATTGNAIAADAKADFCIVDLDRAHLTPCLDLPNLIVHSMHASDVVTTVVGGRVLYDHGRFPTVDAASARRDFLAAVNRLGLRNGTF